MDRHIQTMIQFLNMDMIRVSLRTIEPRLLTDDEQEKLLNLASTPDIPKSRPVEMLVNMLKTKGGTGLLKFVSALEKTTECTGHSDIIKAIKGDPDFPELQRRYCD